MAEDSSHQPKEWVKHLPLIAAGLVALIIALRLLVIATWSRRTAVAILQTGGSATVVTGVLISTIGIAGGAAFGLYLFVSIYFWLATKQHPTRTFWLIIAAGLIWDILVAPLYIWAFTVLFVALGFVVGIISTRHRPQPSEGETRVASNRSKKIVDWLQTSRLEVILVGSVLVALSVIFADNRRWLAPENITLGPEPKVITAYVLHKDEHELAILQGSRPRQVVYIMEPKVVKREICGGTSVWWDAPPLKHILGLTPYPECLQSY
jgi:hypothetical protein